ncbi:hypothetical protein PspLS_05781 [Pyricularia sp. CBS 133598]|nr:hypothetical protein PspLS_05781 [Pyricularia sp. CBS 133598]
MHSDAGWRAADVMGKAVLEPQATSDGPLSGLEVTPVFQFTLATQFGGPGKRKCQCQCQPSRLWYSEVPSARTSSRACRSPLRVAVLSTPSWQGALDYAVGGCAEVFSSSSFPTRSQKWAQVDGDIRLKIQYRMEHPIYHPLGSSLKYLDAPHNAPFRHFRTGLGDKNVQNVFQGVNKIRLPFLRIKIPSASSWGFPIKPSNLRY